MSPVQRHGAQLLTLVEDLGLLIVAIATVIAMVHAATGGLPRRDGAARGGPRGDHRVLRPGETARPGTAGRDALAGL